MPLLGGGAGDDGEQDCIRLEGRRNNLSADSGDEVCVAQAALAKKLQKLWKIAEKWEKIVVQNSLFIYKIILIFINNYKCWPQNI